MQQGVLAPRVLEALTGDDPFGSARARLEGKNLPDSLSKLLYMDFTMYLQDDLLTKVDRATMLASLEARAPFLDHDLSEFAAGIPSTLKLKGKSTKDILKKTVRRRLPVDVIKRRKRGFNIPFSKWMLHGLGDEYRRRFSEERVEARGLFNPTGHHRPPRRTPVGADGPPQTALHPARLRSLVRRHLWRGSADTDR